MPGTFVAAIFVAVVAVIGNVVYRLNRKKPATTERLGGSAFNRVPETVPSDAAVVALYSKWAARVFAVIAVLFTVFASYNPVSTKNVGVVTEFGKPTGSLSNGVHFTVPWAKVTEMDAAIQTDHHQQGAKDSNCITVRIARQATACADVIVKWRVDEGTAGKLFQNYRDFDNVRDNLITTDLQAAMNQAFVNYDALGVDQNGDSTSTSMVDMAKTVLTTMQSETQGLAEIQSIQIPVVHFDGKTQDSLNKLQAAVADTRVATQQQKTNAAEAAANQALAASVDNSPNVLVSKCLDIVAKGTPLPAGFSCFPSTTPVTVPAK